MPKRKVAFIHPDLGIGGAERLVLDVASALSKQGNEIILLTNHFDKNHAFEELKNGEFPVQVYGDWLPRHLFGRFQALCAYIRMIYLTLVYAIFYRTTQKPDVYFVDLIPMAVPILKLFGEKVIYYCHHPDLLASAPGGALKNFYRKPINWLELKSTARADIILVNSEYTASVFRETFHQITKTVQVVYPTVASSFLQAVKNTKNPRPIHQIIPEIPQNAACVFLSINRFHPAKKLDLAINAMEILQRITSENERKGIFLVMAGGYDPQSSINASYFTDLEKLVAEKGLQDKIIFLKSPPDDVKTELLMACDCLVYTPVKEHFGIVPLEAMTVAKPVLACNSGGPRETVDHGNTGYLCEPTPDSLAQFMYRIFKSDNKAMGLKGRKVLQEKFSNESFARNLKKILDHTSVNKKFI
ncbi:Alpha-1,3/1,6-mannosyltransferase ALG2-like Protein [Tribolium castaneum]|uniref:Alpha-1,3/1,6-mannosyltransferase ALG2 n=1 Tax=Tribolium castaneum TaxID=7070 RepID=D6WJ23_TRICA|nr:PREDICTED: alpha-1,3/1,6-mannosyltransferase ALG2 [Tribolium castaneum]EFA03871.1 Alpha-1,3/1,6-mannosyltransferase ALG2-like Protein [Tribolium castaneum]|eukprot:XP_008193014.1 PREDICTED: alpha-1,3/1,6-mannosyltransferase ALG2 [Tribolium castaneum]